MKSFTFNYDDKEYVLDADHCSYMMNDEEYPVEGIKTSDLIEMLSQYQDVDFDVEYYDQPCSKCLTGKAQNKGYFKFLEYHFYIFSKSSKYVISSISKEYGDTSFNKLLKKGAVDNSYIVSVIVCSECGDFGIEIEQCEV